MSRRRQLLVPNAQIDEVVFLFRDDFITDEAAPLTSPRTAEPGPGTMTIVDTGNNMDVVSGRLAVSAVAGIADPSISDDVSRSRTAGMSFYGIINTAGRAYFGWGDVKNAIQRHSSFHLVTSVTLRIFDNLVEIDIQTITTLTDYELSIVLRSSGAFYCIRGGSEFPDWTLVCVGVTDATAALFAGMSRRTSGVSTHDNFRTSQLTAPWTDDFGIATDRKAGSQSAGTTFTHEADFILEWIQTTVPSALQTEVRFRIQDASNHWRVTIDSTGALDLDEVVAGTPTQRGTAAAVVANGERIVIIADDEEISVYENNTLQIAFSGAANFKTETAGELEALGTAGAVDDIVTWPRDITGSARVALNAVAGAR